MTDENRSQELELLKGSLDSMLTYVKGRIEYHQANESPEAERHLEIYVPLAEQLEQYFRQANAETLPQEERDRDLECLDLSKRAEKALARIGVGTFGKLASTYVVDLICRRDIGMKTVDEIQEKLDPHRLDLKGRRGLPSSRGYEFKETHLNRPYFKSDED